MKMNESELQTSSRIADCAACGVACEAAATVCIISCSFGVDFGPVCQGVCPLQTLDALGDVLPTFARRSHNRDLHMWLEGHAKRSIEKQ